MGLKSTHLGQLIMVDTGRDAQVCSTPPKRGVIVRPPRLGVKTGSGSPTHREENHILLEALKAACISPWQHEKSIIPSMMLSSPLERARGRLGRSSALPRPEGRLAENLLCVAQNAL
jgi:hypothetical protein